MRVFLLFLLSVAAFGDWAEVRKLSPDQKIEVVTHAGAHIRGQYVSADDEWIVVQTRSGEDSIERSAIWRVRVAGGSRRIRKGILSTAIGAGAGLAIGFLICPHCTNEGSANPYVGPAGAGGAALGAALGFLPTPYRTVFEQSKASAANGDEVSNR